MATIKDKISIYSSQTENIMEMMEPVEEVKVETETATVYTVEDAEDPIDVLVGAAMTERFAAVSIRRQAPGQYLIENKQVTIEAQGEQND